MLVDQIHFILNLLIAGFVLRLAQLKLIPKNSDFGRALAFIY